jgi:glycerol-3-phosphate dehydrogenase
VVWSYAGVRPLYDDGADNASEVTRDYVLELDAPAGGAPALSVFGGKITTFRRLAEEALGRLARFFPAMKPAWTAGAILPGGDLGGDFEHFLAKQAPRYDFLPAAQLRALARRHGDRMSRVLDGVDRLEAMGQHFGHGLYAREIDFLRREEWAVSAEDVLYRRTKTGLHLSPEQRAAVAEHMARTRR